MKETMTNYMKTSVSVFFATLALVACTNLDEEVEDQVLRDEFGKNPAQIANLVGPLYSGLGNYWGTIEMLNCVTDEMLAPGRGGDWVEPEWKQFMEHTWPSTYWGFDGLWTWAYSNIAKINEKLPNPVFESPEAQAELRTLRAFYHYVAMDNFGNVLIAENLTSDPEQKSRAEVYSFIEQELLESLPGLSTDVASTYSRMNRYVARMILAKLYLNAEVYTGTPEWEKARIQCDSIISSGAYTVANSANFLATFSVTNEHTPEAILAIPFDKSKRTGFYMQIATLHYLHQLTYDLGSSPWNGYCTSAEFYDSFEDTDVRKSMWLTGQIFSSSGEALFDDDKPAILTKEIPAYTMPGGPVARLAGYRGVKYAVERGAPGADMSNDFLIYRISDVYLMRAEANFRLGNAGPALEDVNFIRSQRGVDNFATVTEENLLAERGRELAWEYHRRQDLIRFGKFDDPWTFKPQTPEYRQLFPIPANQLGLNPNLRQNPGYSE
ncbi:MAG TPA: RagB/SusD family nutrient uptake outer membrane protein [Chryseosolibacter sp.]